MSAVGDVNLLLPRGRSDARHHPSPTWFGQIWQTCQVERVK